MYRTIFDTTIAGIPAQIGVIYAMQMKPSFRAHSDIDFYGYSESEWDVLDRKGYKAKWLERKLTDDDRYRIESELFEALKQEDYPW
jgi:hypothetical protein